MINFYAYDANASLAGVYNTNVIDISAYYLHLIAELKLSRRLNDEEKIGQFAFLSHEWWNELQSAREEIEDLA